MSSFSGPLFAAAIVLGLAGVGKLVQPAATQVALRSVGLPGRAWMVRGLAIGEVIVALAVLVLGGPVPAALVALTYAAFAGFAAVAAHRSRGTASCGCFGAASAPVGPIHVTTNVVVAAAALGAVAWPTESLGAAFGDTPAFGIPFVLLTLVLAALIHAALTALPELVEAQGAVA